MTYLSDATETLLSQYLRCYQGNS